MKNSTWSYVRHLIRQHRALIVLLFVAMLSAYPIMLFLTRESIFAQWRFEYLAIYLTQLMSGLPLLGQIGSIAVPFVIFQYLYKKADLDSYYALPITKEKLYRIHFFFGLGMLIVPMLFSHIVGYLELQNLTSQYAPGMMKDYSFSLWLQQAAGMSVGLIIPYVLTTISILCTTNLFNGLIYTGVLHLFPALAWTVWSMFANSSFGGGSTRVQYDPASQYATWVEPHEVYTGMAVKGFSFWRYAVFWVVLAVLLFFASLYFIRKRKVERVNSQRMFSWFYPLCIYGFGGLLLILLLGMSILTGGTGSNGIISIFHEQNGLSVFLFPFIVGLILFFIIQIIREHGVSSIFKTFAKYLLLFVICSGIVLFLKSEVTDRYSHEIVDAAKVDTVEILIPELHSEQDRFDLMHGTVFYQGEEKTSNIPSKFQAFSEQKKPFELPGYGHIDHYAKYVVSDESEIRDVIVWQKKIIDEHFSAIRANGNGAQDYDPSAVVYLNYLDSEGKTIQMRSYSVNGKNVKWILKNFFGIANP